MDHKRLQVKIVVSRVDATAPMKLCVELGAGLEQAGFSVELIEIKEDLLRLRLKHLVALLRPTGEADTVISCGALADMFTALARVFNPSKGRKFISYLHCDQWQDLKFERRWAWAALYFACWRASLYFKNRICCVSFGILNNLPLRLAATTKVIYNHVSLGPVTTANNTLDNGLAGIFAWISGQRRQGRKIVVAFGLFHRRKNFLSLMAAVEDLAHASLLLIGQGTEERALHAAAARFPLKDRVLIHRFVPQPARLCPYADLYVSCSHSEGFGLANLEAASSGIPVILPCHPVNLEVTAHHGNVTYYNPRASGSLREEMQRTLAMPVIERSATVRLDRFSQEAFLAGWVDFLSPAHG